jgi:hypothetical protein
LNHVEVVLAGLSLGHNFRKQSFANGAKHGRLNKWVLDLERVIEFLRLIDGHGSIDNQLAFLLRAFDKRLMIVGANHRWRNNIQRCQDQKKEFRYGHD